MKLNYLIIPSLTSFNELLLYEFIVNAEDGMVNRSKSSCL